MTPPRPLLQLPLVSGPWLERFPRPWQTVGPVSGPSHCADSSLAFYKESSSGITPSLTGYRTGITQTRPATEPRPPAHRVNPFLVWNLTLDLSGMSGSTAFPKDHRNGQALPRRQREDTVGRINSEFFLTFRLLRYSFLIYFVAGSKTI